MRELRNDHSVHPFALSLQVDELKIKTCYFWRLLAPKHHVGGLGDFPGGFDY
jgi:hypothetical protein